AEIFLERRHVRRPLTQRRHDRATRAKCLERLPALALLVQQVADFAVAHRKIALRFRVIGGSLGQALPDGQRNAIRSQSILRVALRNQDLADAIMRERKVALELGVLGIGSSQPFANREGLAERRQRLLEAAVLEQDVAISLVADREIALPG